ncbi:hypothetical protein [Nonomuraea endophytica]|uniref:Uncharacterized protein n=1 Tax=Nonomuraea endophytica TaxID=714136 RepID=A0A7W8A990_9ACTN|nr:hypothetical protein [Nonomuraea endophytica]MBB5081364.1 hypothetical protein [Nonomuraea endophytica]
MYATPSIGRIVHYVSYGTPGGEYTSQCRAAQITEVAPDGNTVGLAVISPTGLFFHSLAQGGCEHHETYGVNPPARRGGTWHWPEQV